jgi:hypothetical protein
MPCVVLNDRPSKFDNDHRDKLTEVITKAVCEASVIETANGNVMHLRTAEIADAFSQVLALILSSHKDAMSPTNLRQLTEETSKRLYRRVNEARKLGAHTRFDFTTYDDDPMH